MTSQGTYDGTTADTASSSLSSPWNRSEARRYCVLTLVYHPQLERIGGQVSWAFTPGTGVEISRAAPVFVLPNGGRASALEDARVSRSPVRLESTRTGIRIISDASRARLEVEGRPATNVEHFEIEVLERGLLLTLGNRIALMMHTGDAPSTGPDLGLKGVSLAVSRLREEIRRLAVYDMPVLLTGESGVGKELVARALHKSGPRSEGPLISVNMAALPPSTAAVELFGHGRGAFTGARDARPGMFVAASGGTLFLDEIGETPTEIQPMLLRAVEAQEIQPLGLSPRKVDTHIIAATDSDLEALVRSGRFRFPLFQRLSTSRILVPALRQRRVDIPILFMYFVREALARFEATNRIDAPRPADASSLSLDAMLELVRYEWPGNVRELRNVAYQAALDGHDRAVARLSRAFVSPASSTNAPPSGSVDLVRELFHENSTFAPVAHRPGTGASSTPPLVPLRDPDGADGSKGAGTSTPVELDEATLCRALEANDWRVGSAARQLGLPRTTIYSAMERLGIRHAASLTREELEEALAAGPPDLEQLAAKLRVSTRGLQLRLHALGWKL